MSQVNKYANKAGYTGRQESQGHTVGGILHIEDDGALIYDGVNVVADKPAAGVGDLAVPRQDHGNYPLRQGCDACCRAAAAAACPGGRGPCPAGRAGADRVARKCFG
ncbi:MAG: hypothetical protein ACLUQ6_02400 [Alistipes onderdonkii]